MNQLAETPMKQTDVSPFPVKGSSQYRLLQALLGGDFVSPISAITDLNVTIVSARVSELRRLGWPIRSKEIPHPNGVKFPLDKLPVYFLDQHFRVWIGGTEGKGLHPCAYPFQDGRGKFSTWGESDYLADRKI